MSQEEQSLLKELYEYVEKHRDETKAILAAYRAKFPDNSGWLKIAGTWKGDDWKEIFKEKWGE